MKNIVIFEKLNPVQNYKVKFSCYLTMVPVFSTMILLVQLMIFSMLNLYYLEGNGLIVDHQVREAYYQQVVSEVLPLTVYILVVIAANFFLSFIVMSWAVSPFTSAEKKIRAFDGKNVAPGSMNALLTENGLIDLAVNSFLLELSSGKPHPEFNKRGLYENREPGAKCGPWADHPRPFLHGPRRRTGTGRDHLHFGIRSCLPSHRIQHRKVYVDDGDGLSPRLSRA